MESLIVSRQSVNMEAQVHKTRSDQRVPDSQIMVSTNPEQLKLPEKCFKTITSRLDFMDRLFLECVNQTWRKSISYDDIKSFRLPDLSCWSSPSVLSHWYYRLAPNTDPLQSIDKEWSTLEGYTLNQILTCILSRCKNLTSLSFSPGDDPDTDSGKLKFVITTDTVRLIKSLAPQIQSLDLSQCAITDDGLLKLLKKTKRNLTELNLNECILVPTGPLSSCHLERSLDEALCKMRKLKRLNPSGHDFDALRLPENGLQTFDTLELSNKTMLADEQLARLWCEGDRPSVYQLRKLVLTDNNSIKRFDIVSHLVSLRRITLQRLARLSDEDLQQIFHWCHKLTTIDLIDCRRVRFRFRWPCGLRRVKIIDPCSFDSQNLVCLGAQCLKLRKFELRLKNLHTNGPDSNAFLAFARVCTKLRSVSIDVVTVPVSIISYFAVYCKKLVSFSCNQVAMDKLLMSRTEITDTIDRRILNLKSIHLSNMCINFHHFMELIDRCDFLKSLSLRKITFDCYSDDIFTPLLVLLAKRCLKLESLELADCPNMSPQSIQTFMDHRKQQLNTDQGTSIKHMHLSYRNIYKNLIKNETEFIAGAKNVGVDFEQESGVDYSNQKGTCFGSSLDTPVFC